MEKVIGFCDDELVVKILSFLPTKDAIRTSVLSKQWKFLWKRVPKLDFNDTNTKQSKKLRRFIYRNLPSHKAPILESLNLKFTTLPFQPYDIESWVETAVSRNNLRHLTISFLSNKHSSPAKLPITLYSCKSLVSLKLDNAILMGAPPHVVHLPSLKTLHLRSVLYIGSLQQILSKCPVLEDLSVERCCNDNLRNFKVIVPSLERLSIEIHAECEFDEFVIDTPSLKYLKVHDYSASEYSCLIKNMPQLKEAEIDVKHSVFKHYVIPEFLRSISSINRLSLTLYLNNGGEDMQRYVFVVNQLEHVKLITSNASWMTSLNQLIRDSPNSLQIYKYT